MVAHWVSRQVKHDLTRYIYWDRLHTIEIACMIVFSAVCIWMGYTVSAWLWADFVAPIS